MTPQQKLLSLIQSLELPIAINDAESLVNELSEGEIVDYTNQCQEIIDLKKNKEELEDDLEAIDDEEKDQEELDSELDKLDQELEERLQTIIDKQQLDLLRLSEKTSAILKDIEEEATKA